MKTKALTYKQKHLIIEFITALLVLLFSYTGIMKIIEHNSFEGVLSQSGLIGHWASLLAVVIPVIELVTAFLLFMPRTRITGMILSVILMCMFTIYVFYMIEFMPHLPCSCGGIIKNMSWGQHLVFNAGFTAIAVTGVNLLLSNKKKNYEMQKHFS